MKKSLITLIILIASLTAISQTTDSLSYLYKQQRNLERDLQAFNKQYVIGTKAICLGGGITLLGTVLTSAGENGWQGLFIMGSGVIITTIGVISHIDAHKYLGGKASLTAKGITIDLN